MADNKKILLLPAWYPNRRSNSGSFFREQAQFLSQNGFDVKVLMIEELHTKNYYVHRLMRALRGKSFTLTRKFLFQSPSAFSYPVIIQKSWSIERKLTATDRAYLRAFDLLTSKLDWVPDLLHLQGMYKYGLSSYLISKKFNVPFLMIEHSPFKLTNYHRLYQHRILDMFQKASKIAGVSHYHAACLSNVHIQRDVEVVWNFIDEQKFTYNYKSKLDRQFVITTVVRASSVKDPVTFFDAVLRFVEIYNPDRPVEIHVVGLASLEDLTQMRDFDKRDIAKYEKLRPLLKFHAWLGRDHIKTLFQKSSVFVSTSVDEPYGVALREAMLCGVPVISTRSGGPEDTLGVDINRLVEVGNHKGIADDLKSIYDGLVKYAPETLRECVIGQSGRAAFLERMQAFYNV